MDSPELASVTQLAQFRARKMHEQEIAEGNKRRLTGQLDHYYAAYDRVLEGRPERAPESLAHPILRSVVSVDL